MAPDFLSITFKSLVKFSSLKMAKYTIVMVRHGESEWNQKNLFCGWYDANLSSKGNRQFFRSMRAFQF